VKRFFKLFQESTKTKVGLRARKDEEVCQRQPLPSTKKFLLFAVLYFLLRSDSEMLSLAKQSTSCVAFNFVDPNALYGDDERGLRSTTWPILADPFDY
jgi:hypothetical protein